MLPPLSVNNKINIIFLWIIKLLYYVAILMFFIYKTIFFNCLLTSRHLIADFVVVLSSLNSNRRQFIEKLFIFNHLFLWFNIYFTLFRKNNIYNWSITLKFIIYLKSVYFLFFFIILSLKLIINTWYLFILHFTLVIRIYKCYITLLTFECLAVL